MHTHNLLQDRIFPNRRLKKIKVVGSIMKVYKLVISPYREHFLPFKKVIKLENQWKKPVEEFRSGYKQICSLEI